jgi:hypothetical protein
LSYIKAQKKQQRKQKIDKTIKEDKKEIDKRRERQDTSKEVSSTKAMKYYLSMSSNHLKLSYIADRKQISYYQSMLAILFSISLSKLIQNEGFRDVYLLYPL